MKLVSVMMPCYNAEAYLDSALESLFRQTYTEYELVAIDDGSTDGSSGILEKWMKRESRIKVYRNEKNLGLSVTRIRAHGKCGGEYLAFLDSDDLWREDKLAVQVDYLEKHAECGAVHSNSIVIDASGKPTHDTFRSLFPHSKCMEGDLFPLLACGNIINTTSMLLRNRSFRESGGFPRETTYNEDWLAWIRFAANNRLGYINECLSSYRIHPCNVTKKHLEYAESRIVIYSIVLKEFSRRLSRRLCSDILYQNACTLAELGRTAEAETGYMDAFRKWPLNYKAAAKMICKPIGAAYAKSI